MRADDDLPATIAMTGGAGALGRHVVRHLCGIGSAVRALTHRTALPADLRGGTVTEWPGSLLDRASLERWLSPGVIVLHLAHSTSMSDDDHRRAIDTLAEACATRGARRVVHVSTAVVAGRTRARVVTEETPCEPATPYERTKLQIEHRFERTAAGRFPLLVARPTAVFGPGLLNLVSLADSIRRGGPAHVLRASLFGRRQLHLVPVDTVARALSFLATTPQNVPSTRAERFLISADTDPGGDFRSVEQRLRHALGARAPLVPRVPLPGGALRLALRLAGRSDADPDRIYDGSKLRRAGFQPAITLDRAIDEFAAWYLDGRS